MKRLFWILSPLSILAGLLITVVSAFSSGLGLTSTRFGEIVCLVGRAAAAICLVCVVIGFILHRKGMLRKAVFAVSGGILFCALIFVGFAVDDMLGTKRMQDSNDDYNVQLYGEGWDSAPLIEGLPRHYQTVLNEFYAVVKGDVTETLMWLGATAMPAYYGDAPLDQIGFALMDLNGDDVEELLVGTTAAVEEGGTAIFCFYSDPANPHHSPSSMEKEVYYLHAGESEGTYLIERGDSDKVWAIPPAEGDKLLGISDYLGEALTAESRLVLDLTPFSQYK